MANSYNFVKFLRGPQAAYNRLSNPDINTLYFIYDEDSTDLQPKGKLYLGRYLINDNVGSTIALSTLADTDIGTLTGTELLRYNASLQKWQPILARDLLSELQIEVNAAVVNSGITKQAGETDADALARVVTVKKEGDLAIVDGSVYVYDDNGWLKLIDASLATISNRIITLENAIADVYTKAETNTAIATAIANANHLTYVTVNSLEGLDPTATNNQNIIYLVVRTPGNTNDGYDEYMAINGAWEKIGNWQADLSNYVQTDDPRLLTTVQVGHLNNLMDANGQISTNSIKDLLIRSVDTNAFIVTPAGQLQLQETLDLNNYVLKSTVGDLSNLTYRSANNSTIVDELNVLADCLRWKPISSE